MADCIMYLLAKCCIDLDKFQEAEEYLLQQAKLDYALYKKNLKKHPLPENGNGDAKPAADALPVNTLEDWLGALSPVEYPNPVPNGAAGFHLLGIVCRRTMRENKAKVYFQLALRLDPMLWMSYENLCEMGVALTLPGSSYVSATGGDNNTSTSFMGMGMGMTPGAGGEHKGDVDNSTGIDPASVFGVIPQALTHIPASQGGYKTMQSMQEANELGVNSELDFENNDHGHQQRQRQLRDYTNASPFSLSHSPIGAGLGNETNNIIEEMEMDPNMTMNSHGNMQYANHPDESFKMAGRLSFGGGASTTPMPGNMHGGMGMGMGMQDDTHDKSTPGRSGLHGTSLFQGNLNLSTIRKPGPGAANESFMGNARRSSGLPSAALFNTPSLTYTPRNHDQEEKEVLRRAREVAGRRYYEPSPETTPPNRIRTTTVPHSSLKLTRKKTRRRFAGPEYDEKHDYLGIGMGVGPSSRHGVGEIGDGSKSRRFLFDNSMDAVASSPAVGTSMDMSVEKQRGTKTAKKKASSAKKLSRVKEDEGTEDSSTAAHTSVQPQIVKIGSGEDGGVQYVLELLCTCGAAQRLLCAFKCKEAIQILHTLPYNQFQTGWVQHQVGRAYFFSVDYANAQRALETMQEVEPHRMKGLELLSTTLYLLKKEVELSNLAQRAVEFDRMSPETWCIVGNCFSQQKEHKTAIAFLRRSIQLDPRFTYAHTLSGHEFVANEDFDHAIASFRNAIRVDERHYNAWNGLGEIYFRQEKYDLAESHFQKALSINPQGSVIRCNLGQAQHANGKHELALKTLALVDKRNPQAQFQRANILISMDRLNEALKELEKVRDTAPREGSIHFAMGRVLKKLGKPEKAMRCFLTALDLDPKENTLIKSAIDRLDEPDMDEDVSAF